MNCKEFRKVEGFLVGGEISKAASDLCEYAEKLEKELVSVLEGTHDDYCMTGCEGVHTHSKILTEEDFKTGEK